MVVAVILGGTPGNGTIGQGYAGGTPTGNAGGGGGGAGFPGSGINGGNGLVPFGDAIYYAGGGGGTDSGPEGTGGLGGGGAGSATVSGHDGVANTGGGGGSTYGDNGGGGAGGSGIIILREVSLSSFSTDTVADGASAVSTIYLPTLVGIIQDYVTDTYFNDPSKFSRVLVYYKHQDGRQQIIVTHVREGVDLVGTASWRAGAKDGTWEKVLIRSFDANGAVNNLPRSAIGSGEDLAHTGYPNGSMALNT